MSVPPATDASQVPEGADHRLQDIDKLLHEAAQSAQSAAQAVESTTTQDDFDRSRIAKTVMYVYAGSIAAGFFFLAARAVYAWTHQKDDWAAIGTDISDLIKIGVLPILTLILGYYFGKSKG